ncbi:MAG TPA: hypothetical protein VFQ58_09305 [Flavisolibacter sp.]|jgi:hypothetical protein|nr:hypothetical protein [Flavisolibacter sp.]
MKRIIIYVTLLLFFVSCNKSKFKTQPQVQITSFGPSEVNIGQLFKLKAKVTDKEGDAQDSVILVGKLYNPSNNFLLRTDPLPFSIANFGVPSNQEIEIEVDFDYGQIVNGTIQISTDRQDVDRAYSIGIIVKDKAGNKSDFVETNKIILKKL